MDPFPLWFFYREIARQCQFARMAYEDLKQASNEYHQPRPVSLEVNSEDVAQIRLFMAGYEQWLTAMATYDQKREAAYDRLWYAVQTFMVAARNISKLLWPPDRPLFLERAPELSAVLEVEENSPLKQ